MSLNFCDSLLLFSLFFKFEDFKIMFSFLDNYKAITLSLILFDEKIL